MIQKVEDLGNSCTAVLFAAMVVFIAWRFVWVAYTMFTGRKE